MPVADHLLALILLLVYPAIGYRSFKRLQRRIAAGERVDRTRLYGATMAGHWLLFAATLGIWIVAGRDFAALGVAFAVGPGFAAAGLVALAVVVLLLLQARSVRNASPAELARIRDGFGAVGAILPRNRAELARFNALAVTAGIVEETLWRGYLFWYLGAFMPLAAVAAVSTAGFALGHAYQGIGNVPKIALVGAVFAILYVMSGSLWLPIGLHAAVDLLQGRLACDVLRRNAPDDAGPPLSGSSRR